MKFIKEIMLVLLIIGSISCKSNRFEVSLTQAETTQVEMLLQKVYQSFAYGEAEEPDWELMRSVFLEGAQFVGETSVGVSPRPQTVDEFISSWQQSIRNNNSPSVESTERIIEAKATKVGRLIRVDVVFQAAKSNDPSPRKYGLDSLLLALDDGVWKILSFVVHYESKLSKGRK